MQLSIITILFLVAYCRADEKKEWSYDDQENWGGQCAPEENKLKKQSPINIEKSKDLKCVDDINPLTFTGYDKPINFNVKNDGHAIVLTLLPENESETPTVTGGKMGSREFIPHGIFFHWPSEHTFQNKNFPLEIHFVIYRNKYGNISSALEHEGMGVQILNVFVDEDDQSENKAFEAIANVVPKVSDTLDKPEQGSDTIVLQDLLPKNTDTVYNYQGSLTIPDCTEGVLWTIFEEPIKITKAQLDKITKDIKSQDGGVLKSNNRKIQELNGYMFAQTNSKTLCD